MAVVLTESEDTNKATANQSSSSTKKQKSNPTLDVIKASPVAERKIQLQEAVKKAGQ